MVASDLEAREAAPLARTIAPPPPSSSSAVSQPTPAYSAFSSAEKRWIVAIVAFAGWFSSLSSFIYFPAIPFIAADLDTSIERINLTVTAYLIMSGIFPSVVGDAADNLGRRPVFVATLAVYVAANIGLALQSSFALLVFLRMLQSAGISGAYAITYGVVGDLFTAAERGGYAGIVSFVLNTPPSIGPLVSGLLMQRWGWRSIFWFLSVISPCCLAAVVVFLPETSRRIVGDGSTPARRVNKPLWPLLVPRKGVQEAERVKNSNPKIRSCRLPNPLTSLILLRDPGTAISICTVAIYYTIYSCLQASLSTLFAHIYETSGLVTGLTYLPFGVACAISAFATGNILDLEYRQTAVKHGIPVDKSKNHNLDSFPIEEARLGSIKYFLALCCFLTIGYGWSLEYRVHMAVPLVLQFFTGLTMQGVFTTMSTLLVDIHPDCPSTAQAASNLIRCETAAGGLALLDLLIQNLGPGWCFVFFAAVGLSSVPLLLLLQLRGLLWRRKRASHATHHTRGRTLMKSKGGGDELEAPAKDSS